MTEEQKKALIDWLKEGIELREEYGFNGNLLASMRIALSALTAQPVKLPDRYDIGSMMDVDVEKDDDGPLYLREDVIGAIRAAGYEVQE